MSSLITIITGFIIIYQLIDEVFNKNKKKNIKVKKTVNKNIKKNQRKKSVKKNPLKNSYSKLEKDKNRQSVYKSNDKNLQEDIVSTIKPVNDSNYKIEHSQIKFDYDEDLFENMDNISENNMAEEFDLKKAVIYSEILQKPLALRK